MYCPNCGTKNEEGSVYCGNCGTSLDGKTTIVYQNESVNADEKYNPWAIAGFVLSLVNVLFGVVIIPGVLGLIFSSMGNSQIKREGGKGKGLAIAGLIVSIVTLVLYVGIPLLVFGAAACIACPFIYL